MFSFVPADSNPVFRVHFLMSGYVRYNLKPSDPDESAASKAKAAEETPPRLKLQLDRDLVTLHSCSVDIRPADLTLQRWTLGGWGTSSIAGPVRHEYSNIFEYMNISQ